MSDDYAEAARRRQEIEAKPVPTRAREIVLDVLREFSGRTPAEVDALALELGDEIRAGLQREHEDDLGRARSRSFDYGVRSALRILRDTGRLTGVEEERIAGQFAAGPTLDLVALHDDLVPLLGPGNDDVAAREQANAVVDLLRERLP